MRLPSRTRQAGEDRFTRRNVVFVLLGVAALLLKRHYSGPLAEAVHGYAGNLSVSFAVYFIVAAAAARHGWGVLGAAGSALLAVEAFEVTNGFGVMSNTYDPLDLLANAAGISLALAVDLATQRLFVHGAKAKLRGTPGR